MKYLIIIASFFTFCLLYNKLVAQDTKIDSLENLLQVHTADDTFRVNILNELAYKLYLIDVEQTLKYAKEANNISSKIRYEKGEAKSLVLIGIYHDEKSDYLEALVFYNRALHIFEKINDKKGITKCYNNIGIIYRYQGDYARALEYYFKSLEIAEELNDKVSIGKSYNNIGVIYFYQSDYAKSLEYYQKSLKIDKEVRDRSGESCSLNNIGIIYEYQADYAKALEYYKKSLAIKEELGNKSGIAICLSNMGNIYKIMGDYANAFVCYQKSLELCREIGRKSTETHCYVGLSSLYLAQNNVVKAVNNSKKAYSLAMEIGSEQLIMESAEILSKSYYALQKYKEAYEYHVIFKQMNDSLFNEKNTEKLTAIEFKYKYEKEKELAELAQLKKDALVQEKERRQEIVRNVLIGGFIFMFLVALIVYRNLVQKRKTNKLLATQKEDIEWRNKALFIKNDEIKLHSERLRSVNTKLKEANKTKDKFFSVISHDLKSPFNAILGYSNLLSEYYESYDDDKRKRMIGDLNSSANSAFKLLEDLLTWSRSQLGGVEFSPEILHLDELISETVYYLNGQATNKEIKVLNEVPHKTLVYADKGMLSAITRNLISNAIKFTHNGGEIRIYVEITDSGIIVSVADNGVGISEKVIPHIFDISENSKTSGTNNESGTGLGLILCKEFVEQHGGKIWVESKVGVGSIFSFTLPKKK
jgi:signal transduction histidine kinase